MPAFLMLICSVFAEVFGDSMMKYSDGFRRKLPLLGVAAGYLVSFYMMSIVLQEMPLGLSYAIWTGLGVALTAVVGAIFWHEGLGWRKVLALAIIVVGVVILKVGA